MISERARSHTFAKFDLNILIKVRVNKCSNRNTITIMRRVLCVNVTDLRGVRVNLMTTAAVLLFELTILDLFISTLRVIALLAGDPLLYELSAGSLALPLANV